MCNIRESLGLCFLVWGPDMCRITGLISSTLQCVFCTIVDDGLRPEGGWICHYPLRKATTLEGEIYGTSESCFDFQDVFFLFGGLAGAFATGIKCLLVSRVLSGVALGISEAWQEFEPKTSN